MSDSAPRARAELIEDGGAAAAVEGFLPLAAVPRRRGRHPHAADRDRRGRRAAGAAARPRDRRRARARRHLALRLPRLRRPRGRRRSTPPRVDFSATGLVSAFFRHRLGEPPLAGATPRNVVQIADPALPRKSRPSDRRQVRRNLENGYTLELVRGGETSAAQRAGFLDLYEQTMRRTDAAGHYFFAAAYFDQVARPPSAPGSPSPPTPRASSPPPRSPRSATATSTTTSAAAPTPASPTRR